MELIPGHDLLQNGVVLFAEASLLFLAATAKRSLRADQEAEARLEGWIGNAFGVIAMIMAVTVAKR